MSLKGLHLLITRPQPQAERWATQLQVLGALTTLSPVMTIEPVAPGSSEAQLIKQTVFDLDHYSMVIFVSQNAVEYGVNWIDDYWPQLPVGVSFVGIGKATQAALSARGLFPDSDHISDYQQSPMNSESLLAEPFMQTVAGQKILIMRGFGGRTHLQQVLTSRGAKVDNACLYHRFTAKVFDIDQAFLKDTAHERIITAHSGESIENLVTLTPASQRAWLYNQTLLVPGLRAQQLAQKLGFNNILMAINATHDSMLEAIYEWQEKKKQHP